MSSHTVACISSFAILLSTLTLAQPTRTRAPSHTASATAGSQFAPAVIYDAGVAQPSSVAAADVNGDGILDVLVSGCLTFDEQSGQCSKGMIAVLLGNGDGTFQAAVAYEAGGNSPGSFAVADVNGDGKPDVIIGNGEVGVLLGNGDGTFQTAVTYDSGGGYTTSVAVADVNGDGKLDVATNPSINVGILLGNGDGSFQPAVTYGLGPDVGWATSVLVADVNGDAKPDVLATDYCVTTPGAPCTPTGPPGGVSVLLGKGDGTFETAVTYILDSSFSASAAVGDLNADGWPDFVVSGFCEAGTHCGGNGTIDVFLDNSKGTVQSGSYDPGGYLSESVALKDVNADGILDVLVVNECDSVSACNYTSSTISDVGVLLGNGDGTFQPAVVYRSGGYYASSIAVADVNGDGSPDLIVTNRCDSGNCSNPHGTVGVLLNTASGIASSTVLSPISPGTVAFGTSITFSASVGSLSGPPPAGQTVTFKNAAANVTLGAGSLSKGTATFTSSVIPAGSYSVVASYPGGSGFWSSVSSPPQLLNVQDFKLAANPVTVTVSPGQSGSTTITVTTYGNLNAQSLSKWNCSGLPSASSCSFGSVDAKNQIPLKINTAAAADLRWPLLRHYRPFFYAFLLPGLLGMVSVAGSRCRSRGVRLLAFIPFLSLLMLWVACGGSGSGGGNGGRSGTPTGSSTVTISATSGSLEHSTTITLNVQ